MEITEIYIASPGAPFGTDKAQAYGEYLTKIQEEKGPLTPSLVVKKAKAKKSVIHDYFEWDDTIAGPKYRIHQARRLMNHIQVEIIDNGDKKPRAIKMFHNIQIMKESKDRAYLSLSTIINSDDYRKQIVEKAMVELRGWQERYRQYSELKPIFKAIDKLKTKITKK